MEGIAVAIAEPIATEPTSVQAGDIAEALHKLDAHLVTTCQALECQRDSAVSIAIAVNQLEVVVVVGTLDCQGAGR